MKKILSLLLAATCIMAIPACKKQENKPPISLEEIEKIYETDPNAAAWTMVEAMSLDEKIYQLFIVSPEALSGGEAVTEVNDAVREGFTKYFLHSPFHGYVCRRWRCGSGIRRKHGQNGSARKTRNYRWAKCV